MQSRSREFNVLYYVHIYVICYHVFYILFNCSLVSLSLLLMMILLLTVRQLYLTVTIVFSAEGARASATSPPSTEADDRALPEDHPQTGMRDLLGRCL